MKCAICATNEELCESVTIKGVKEPRICKKCLAKNLTDGEEQPINFGIWIQQIRSLPNGKEMLEILAELDKNDIH